MKPGRKEKLTAADIRWLRQHWTLPIPDLASAKRVDVATIHRYARRYGFGPHIHHQYQDRTIEPRPVPTMWRCPECLGRSLDGPMHESHGVAA